MEELVECIFFLKSLVAVAFIPHGVLCSFNYYSCAFSTLACFVFLVIGLEIIANSSFSFISIILWLYHNQNPHGKKIIGLLLLPICSFILVINGLKELYEADGYAKIEAAVALSVDYTVIALSLDYSISIMEDHLRILGKK